MCGRYLLLSKAQDLLFRYNLNTTGISLFINGEIYPSCTVPVITNENKKAIELLKWGYILKDNKNQLINARSESINEKTLFKESFHSKRCLIPVDAFYEWKSVESKKERYIISLRDKTILSMAGIYKTFIDENNIRHKRFVVITTNANEAMSKIHSRMPVILDKESEDVWLNKSEDITQLKLLLRPYNNENLSILPGKEENQAKYEQIKFFDL